MFVVGISQTLSGVISTSRDTNSDNTAAASRQTPRSKGCLGIVEKASALPTPELPMGPWEVEDPFASIDLTCPKSWPGSFVGHRIFVGKQATAASRSKPLLLSHQSS